MIICYFLLNYINYILDTNFYFNNIYINENISIFILKFFYKKILFKKFFNR